jgi:hypothetical protein
VLLCARDRTQARIVFGYAVGLLKSSPFTAREIVAETAETVTLRSGTAIEIRTSDFRSVRAPTCLGVVIDEACFLRDETSAAPDIELYRAVRPSLMTLSDSLLVGISSPWRRSGLLYT